MGKKFIFICVALFFFNFLMAQEFKFSAEPTWLYKIKPDFNKKPTEKNISNGYFLELVNRQTNIAAETEYIHIIRNIINESGVQNASSVSVVFSPDYEKLVFHKIQLIRNGVIVHEYKANEIKVIQEENETDNFLYHGTKRAFVNIKDVRTNDKIEFAYSLIGFNPVFQKKFQSQIYFTASLEVTNYFQTLLAPKNSGLHFKFNNDASKYKHLLLGDMHVFHWDNPVIKKEEVQDNVPSWFDNYPNISITNYNDWKEVCDWGLNLFNHYKVQISNPLQQKISEWKKASGNNQDAMILSAVNFVQNQIRYLGIESGIYSHKPHDPSKIYEQRFGDCKDKAFLLVTILRALGVNAYVALANTSLREKLANEDPGPNAFNHAIVAIEEGESYKFIDATIAFQQGPFKDRYTPPYGYVLILKEANVELTHLDPGPIKTSIIQEKLFVKYKENGPSYLKVHTEYFGNNADNFRNDFAGTGLANLQKNYETFYSKLYDSLTLDKEVVHIDDSLNNVIKVDEQYKIASLWTVDENGKESFDIFPSALNDLFSNPSKSYKNAPISISFPKDIDYKLEIHMPDVWGFDTEELHIHNPYFQFDFSINQIDSIIVLNYIFKSFKDHIPIEYLNSYKDDFKKINETLGFNLKRGIQGSSKSNANNSNFSWYGLFIFLLTLVSFFFLIKWLNKKENINNHQPEIPYAFNGWMLFLAFGIFISIILSVVQVFQSDFFSALVWSYLQNVDGQDIRFIFILEHVSSLGTALFGTALLFWFNKKRDIFPKMFIAYIIGKLIAQFLITIIYEGFKLPSTLDSVKAENMTNLFRFIFYGAIWISYVLKSNDIKNVFIKPYKEQVDL